LICAGDETVSLVHRNHHSPEIVRLEHRFPGFDALHSFGAAENLKAAREALQLVALTRIDNAHYLHGNVQRLGDFFDFGAVTEENWYPQPQ